MNIKKQILTALWSPAALALAALILSGTLANADPFTLALTSDGTTGTLLENNGEADGYKFQTGALGLTVNWLGLYDAKNGAAGTVGDGLFASHRVSIWRENDGTLVAQTTVLTTDSLAGNFRGHIISAATLAANTGYVIAADYGGAGDRQREGANPAEWGVYSGISGLAGRYGNAGGGMPISGWGVMIGPNFGYTVDSVDSSPPTPNPMTWASVPAAVSTTSITMTATTASDTSGVEYSFTETSGNPGATNSGWQDSPVYTDTGLTSGTSYTYTVKARDKSIAQNAGTESSPATATAITPSPLTVALTRDATVASLNEYGGEADGYRFSTGDSPLTVKWLGLYDAPNGGAGTVGDGLLASHRVSIWRESDGVLVAQTIVLPADTLLENSRGHNIPAVILAANTGYVTAYDAGGGDRMREGNDLSGWQFNWISGLAGRYGSAGGGMPPSAWAVMIGPNFGFTGESAPPNPNPMTWASVPAATGDSSITMTATTASDVDGVEYSFTETSGNPGATNSGWQDSPVYTDTGLSPATNYTYTVTARDKSTAQNATVPSAPASASTLALDTSAPTPSPMTWLSVPMAASATSVTMTATTASDPSGVEYFFTETSGNPGATNSGWQASPVYIDSGLSPATTYTYTVTARDKSIAQNATAPSAPAAATTDLFQATVPVWNVNIGNQLGTSDNFVGAATENTQNSTWNSVTSLPRTAMALADSTNSSSAGVTLDISGGTIGYPGQDLTSGGKIFYTYLTGFGSVPSITIKSLSRTKAYDVVIYSDWWWKSGDSLPVKQSLGTGLTGTIYVNRILTGTNGTVPPLTEDTNPADVTTGAGNVGNWYRIKGLSPDANGHLGFQLGDAASAPFSGFQLVQARSLSPHAEMLSLGLPGNPAVINGTHVTLTVPYGTNVTALAPTFTLWPGATCVPVSGTSRNFTTPQTYTVTSSDSLINTPYTVTVVIAPALPEFTLTAPATWDGRQTITVQPNITNLPLLEAAGAANLNYKWSVAGVATTSQVTPGVLTLTRSQGSGPMIVTLAMDNGGVAVIRTVTVNAQEPVSDPWIMRTAGANEKPVNGQFFARDPATGFGMIYYNGTQSGSPAGVFLKVYTTDSGDVLYATHRQSLVGGAYAFTAPIMAGKTTYKVVYGTTNVSNVDTPVATVTNLVCGDAYIIEGQSNAVAIDNSAPGDPTTDPWVRTYGKSGAGWGYANSKGSDMAIGFWGMALAKRIVLDHQMPVCFINGAVGGTRIDEHQANPADHIVAGSLYSIYADLLNRVTGAGLTHGIRGIFWHQGESDCSNFGPINDWDYTTYRQLFLEMSSAWKQDYPNLQHHIIYQVMPSPCSIGPKGDQLREVQRNLPWLYSKMSILNTLGLAGYEDCHFSAAGYANIADRMAPVVSRDFYGVAFGMSVTAPNLKRAYFTTSARTAIALEFDQPMSWSSFSLPNYYLDKVAGKVTSGSASGNVVTLQLSSSAASNATLDYLEDNYWNPHESVSSLLYGANAIPALTFADIPIGTLAPYESWASSKNLSGADAVGDADPDHDGIKNALEFVLGGEPNPSVPGSNSVALLPNSTYNSSGDLIFTFQRKIASIGVVNLTFQWSTDLTFPTPDTMPISEAGSTIEGIDVAISNFDAATHTILITVPAAKAASGRLFGRLHAVVP